MDSRIQGPGLPGMLGEAVFLGSLSLGNGSWWAPPQEGRDGHILPRVGAIALKGWAERGNATKRQF